MLTAEQKLSFHLVKY